MAVTDQVFVHDNRDALNQLVVLRQTRVLADRRVIATDLRPIHAVALEELVDAVNGLDMGCSSRIGNRLVVNRMVRATALLQLLEAHLLSLIPAYPSSNWVLVLLTAVATALQNHAAIIGGSFADKCAYRPSMRQHLGIHSSRQFQYRLMGADKGVGQAANWGG
ncbi:hypothetical protein E2562_003316 [Oryza meyeriana var. granulata]|uniref:Uncharacterized protein n=1 Tax=Oryza meyeriana var. granulata TaxID=110450 RepID=A0A6G1EEB3_9ORYZ|nr:hypothetical protein E2562_003316 [Oryza meyeriana var. granulata]